MEKPKTNIINKSYELPPDILQQIFSKIPFFNLPTCRLVSRTWNNLISSCKFDPSTSIYHLFFARFYSSRHRNLHCVEFDPQHVEGMSIVASFAFHPDFCSASSRITIINSCSGLISLLITKRRRRGQRRDVVCVLNPITNEYFKHPNLRLKGDKVPNYCYGLGFSPKTNQYKLARTHFAHNEFIVDIFAFGTSCEWTPIGSVPNFLNEYHGVYFNGGLYWVGSQKQLPNGGLSDYTGVVYRLDLNDEKFKKISIPFGGDEPYVGVYNGTLYLTLCCEDFDYHVWKMKEDFSWSKEFVLALPENILHSLHRHHPIGYYLQLVKFCEDGSILCLCAGILLIVYDPKTQQMEILTDQDFEIKEGMWFHQIESFSFNSLHNTLTGKC
ncbi:putative F-box protein [Cucumis melo var. makuwa]|uniref:F-box protein At3g21120 n=2 Tax=Cucumis melo TaxID=3656 RepID=A0A1S3BQV8_CUCME|nr:F-box protein At3g07870-like [Cucumis melo]TYK10199.1 putative F-box protein [Cucumis melo var. makuwa]